METTIKNVKRITSVLHLKLEKEMKQQQMKVVKKEEMY